MSTPSSTFEELRRRPFGLAVHWTTWTASRPGAEQLSFPAAVDAFDTEAFAQQAQRAGAGHVLFTITHELQYMPCPHPVVERILPGRTCPRDLVSDLHASLARRGIALLLYYHHGADAPTQDVAWQTAVGSLAADPTRFYTHIQEILQWLGERYGPRVRGYWFDAGWALARRPHPPWEKLTAAAKAGFPGRLVCYNPAVRLTNSLTSHQDYMAGELEGLDLVPGMATAAPTHTLPWHALVTWHLGGGAFNSWGVTDNTKLPAGGPPVEMACDFVRRYQKVNGAVTFNVLCFQDGTIHEPDLRTLCQVSAALRSS